jgi:hypothetical protein
MGQPGGPGADDADSAARCSSSPQRFALCCFAAQVSGLAFGVRWSTADGVWHSMVGPKGQENSAQALAWVASLQRRSPCRGVREGFCKATKRIRRFLRINANRRLVLFPRPYRAERIYSGPPRLKPGLSFLGPSGQPSTVNRQPPTGDRQSAIGDWRPATDDRRPTTDDRRPPTANRQPLTGGGNR